MMPFHLFAAFVAWGIRETIRSAGPQNTAVSSAPASTVEPVDSENPSDPEEESDAPKSAPASAEADVDTDTDKQQSVVSGAASSTPLLPGRTRNPAPASSMRTGQAKRTQQTQLFRIRPHRTSVRHFQKTTTSPIPTQRPKQQLTSTQHPANTCKFNRPTILLVRTAGHFRSARPYCRLIY